MWNLQRSVPVNRIIFRFHRAVRESSSNNITEFPAVVEREELADENVFSYIRGAHHHGLLSSIEGVFSPRMGWAPRTPEDHLLTRPVVYDFWSNMAQEVATQFVPAENGDFLAIEIDPLLAGMRRENGLIRLFIDPQFFNNRLNVQMFRLATIYGYIFSISGKYAENSGEDQNADDPEFVPNLEQSVRYWRGRIDVVQDRRAVKRPFDDKDSNNPPGSGSSGAGSSSASSGMLANC